MKRACLTPPEMQEFLLGSMPDADWKSARGHLAECEACRTGFAPLFLDDLTQSSTVLRTRRSDGHRASPGPAVQPSETWMLGSYRIVRELGHGGQAQVFLAEDTKLGRRVALKVLATAFSQSAHGSQRFHREATALSKLNHPGICAIHDAGEIDGIPYIALQYVEGETLARQISVRKEAGPGHRSREEILGVTRIVERSARAMHAAHEAGLIHRDLKPSNIMITPEGEPVILDFGLARDELGGLETLTQSGDVMGTPAYMSPEQLSGEVSRLDRRTDVYALGVTLYQCLTLHLPFEAATREALYRQILTDAPPDPRQLCPDLPKDLKVVLEAALEKSLERRYASCLELAEDLRRLREYEPIRARPAGVSLRFWRWVQRNPVVATSTVSIFVVLAVALCISLVLLRRVTFEEGQKTKALAGEKAQTQALAAALIEKSEALEARSAALLRAEALRISARAEGNIDRNPGLALLLALKANEHAGTAFATSTLLKAMAELYQIHTLLGHREEIQSIAVSPAGSLLATASVDGTGRIWDSRTGMQTALLWGHTDLLEHVQFSNDGRRVVTCSRDETARIWDARSGAPLKVLHCRGTPVQWAEFSFDGKKVATVASDSSIRIWSSRTGKELLRVEGTHSTGPAVSFGTKGDRVFSWSLHHSVFGVWDAADGRLILGKGLEAANNGGLSAVSPDARWGVISSPTQSGALDVWEVESGRQIATLGPHRKESVGDYGSCAAFSEDSRYLARTDIDNQVVILDTSAWKEVATLAGHTLAVTSLEFSSDGSRLVTASDDKTLRVWETGSGALKTVLKGHSSYVTGAAFLPGGSEVFSVGGDGLAQTWGLEPRGGVVEVRRPATCAQVPTFSPDGSKLCILDGNLAHIHEVSSGRLLVTLAGHSSQIRAIRISADGLLALTASHGASLALWDATSGQRRWTLQSPPSGFTRAEFSRDGQSVLAMSYTGVFRRLDLQGKEILKIVLKTEFPYSASFSLSPDDESVCLSSSVIAQIHRLGDGQQLGALDVPRSSMSDCLYSPDGRWIATNAWAQDLLIWDARSFKRVAALRGHVPGTTVIAFSPDGKMLISGSTDKTACVWSIPSGARLFTLRGHTQFVCSVDFSADGTRALTSGLDGLTRIWDTKTGSEVFSVTGPVGLTMGAVIGPDGLRFLTLDRLAVRIWPMDPQTIAEERKPRELTLEEMDLYEISSREERGRMRAVRDRVWFIRDVILWLRANWPDSLHCPQWLFGARRP